MEFLIFRPNLIPRLYIPQGIGSIPLRLPTRHTDGFVSFTDAKSAGMLTCSPPQEVLHSGCMPARPKWHTWGPLGLLWGPLGLLWSPLGLICAPPGLLWGPLGLLWGPLGLLWGALGLPRAAKAIYLRNKVDIAKPQLRKCYIFLQ